MNDVRYLNHNKSLNSVTICSTGELFGGVERHIIGLSKGLQERSISLQVILFNDKELATQLRSKGIQPIILASQNWLVLKTALELAKLLKQHNTQLVHIHGYKATVFCVLARMWYSFKVIKTEHGLVEPMLGRSRLVSWRERFYRQLDAWMARKAQVKICYVSQDLVSYYQNDHRGLKTEIIKNGIENIDKSSLKRPPELQESGFNIVIVGRLDTVKGIQFAINAVAKLAIPHLHLYIIGIGPCELQLKEQAEKRQIENFVHFLGFKRNVYDYIAHADALLMPSLHEGLPYTLLEAMALNTPVIASRVGGLAEVLTDGVTGLLTTPADSESIAQKIMLLYDNPQLRHQLSTAARQLQEHSYSLESMTSYYLEYYQESLQEDLRSTVSNINLT